MAASAHAQKYRATIHVFNEKLNQYCTQARENIASGFF
jgi:hypothetical protein